MRASNLDIMRLSLACLLASPADCQRHHLDFVEIGTSSFNTLIEKADDATFGMSVDMMRKMETLQNERDEAVTLSKVNVLFQNVSLI